MKNLFVSLSLIMLLSTLSLHCATAPEEVAPEIQIQLIKEATIKKIQEIESATRVRIKHIEQKRDHPDRYQLLTHVTDYTEQNKKGSLEEIKKLLEQGVNPRETLGWICENMRHGNDGEGMFWIISLPEMVKNYKEYIAELRKECSDDAACIIDRNAIISRCLIIEQLFAKHSKEYITEVAQKK